MVVAVAKALEDGARAIICASTGNTSASAAAYGAAAGLEVIVVLPAGPDRGRQARPGADRRRPGRRRRGQLRRRAADRPRAGRARDRARPPADARQLGQPASPRRARRRPPSRSARTSAARPTTSPSRSAMPATSAPTGRASATTATRAWSRRGRCMLGFQAAGAAPLVLGHRVDATRDRGDRHPHRRSGQRRAGAEARATSPAGASRPSPTRRSSPRTATWRASRASSASPPRRRRWPACAGWSPRAPSTRAPPSSVLTGHGLKDPATASARQPLPLQRRRRSTA